MNSGRLILLKEEAVARLILDNPARRNAISMEMWAALDRALDDLARDDSIRVVILEGAGDKAFSAGADISEFTRRHADAAAVSANSARDERVMQRIEALDKPSIAQISGYCMGGAVALALSCDLRIASEDARFAIPPAKLGHCYPALSIARVLRAVGLANTREIFYTARQFSAGEAMAMGLVNRVLPQSKLAGFVADYAAVIAANAPLTVKAAKRITTELVKESGARDLELCDALVTGCFTSADAEEGRRAFLEKRAPRFTGR